MRARYPIPLVPLALGAGCGGADVVGAWTADDFEVDGDDRPLEDDAFSREIALEVDVLDYATFTYARREEVDGLVYLYSVAWGGDTDRDRDAEFQLQLESEDVVAVLDLTCTLDDADTLTCEGERENPRQNIDWELVFTREQAE